MKNESYSRSAPGGHTQEPIGQHHIETARHAKRETGMLVNREGMKPTAPYPTAGDPYDKTKPARGTPEKGSR